MYELIFAFLGLHVLQLLIVVGGMGLPRDADGLTASISTMLMVYVLALSSLRPLFSDFALLSSGISDNFHLSQHLISWKRIIDHVLLNHETHIRRPFLLLALIAYNSLYFFGFTTDHRSHFHISLLFLAADRMETASTFIFSGVRNLLFLEGVMSFFPLENLLQKQRRLRKQRTSIGIV